MARARNIKPGFFVNEDIADCDPMARLLFISMWMLADREGRIEHRPKKIKMQTFPYDDCNIDNLILQLSERSFIFIYEAMNKPIIQINNWSKHQNPHHKEVESELPRFDKCIHKLITTQAQVNHDPNTVCDGYIPLSLTIRERIFSRDGRNCSYCESKENLEIDHILPVSKGGNSIDENLQVLCKQCNVMKSNSILDNESWKIYVRRMLKPSLTQDQTMKVASCPTDSLIPDCLNRIPDLVPPQAASSKELAKPVKKSNRLPDNWEPTQDYWDAAVMIGNELNIDMRPRLKQIAHKFKDYWIAKSGKDATKADWLATWRNWIRREAENGKGGSGAIGKKSYGEQRSELFDAVTDYNRATDF